MQINTLRKLAYFTIGLSATMIALAAIVKTYILIIPLIQVKGFSIFYLFHLKEVREVEMQKV